MLNKTRDLEAKALRTTLADLSVQNILEIGCGTGKNTEWLCTKAAHVTAVDFSAGMLEKAKEKITAGNVVFRQADITQEWTIAERKYDLVTCSLILEHIKDLDHVFAQARQALNDGGAFYLGELHPFKQYTGSKAKFDTGSGIFELECFVHHVADFFSAAKINGFICIDMNEWFDDDDRITIPRVITMVFRRVS